MLVKPMLVLVLCISGTMASWKYAKTKTATSKVKDAYVVKFQDVLVPALNMKVYDTDIDSNKKSRILIAVYDVFGNNDRIRQLADIISLGSGNNDGFRVVVPDFLHGGPINGQSWEGGIGADVRKVIRHYKDKATSFGIFGFCWGGRISVKAGQEIPEIKAVGLIHPYQVVTSDANTLKVPALLCPSGGEPDMLPFVEIAAKNLGSANVVHHRFVDMVHGFAGAHGQWDKPLVRQRVDEVVNYAINFFDKHVK